MKHILLTGAGFSRNWGGWLANEAFEYLLGSIHVDDLLRQKLWQTKERGGGFEDTLSEMQSAYAAHPHGQEESQLRTLTNGVMAMFAEMASGYDDVKFDATETKWPIKTFLAEFDAIYTLNQDTLIEQKYAGPRWGERFVGCTMPGLKSMSTSLSIAGRSYFLFEPDPTSFKLFSDHQPYIKLHGSFNWIQDQGSMLILGGNKASNIEKYPLLKWYHELFRADLESEDVRLMIIGYSFNDAHINEAITNAISKRRNMRVFIIDPDGVDILDKRKKNAPIPQPLSDAPLLEAISPLVIGASRRPLRSTFADDVVEQNKVWRFFKRYQQAAIATEQIKTT